MCKVVLCNYGWRGQGGGDQEAGPGPEGGGKREEGGDMDYMAGFVAGSQDKTQQTFSVYRARS